MVTDPKPRRRSEKSRAAIFGPTRELALERGFDKLTDPGHCSQGRDRQTDHLPLVAEPARPTCRCPTGRLRLDLEEFPDSGDIAEDLTAWARALAKSLTTGNFSASLRVLTVGAMEDTDAADRLRATFSPPLHAAVRRRLEAEGDFDDRTTYAVADAIVGGVVYPILSEGPAYKLDRAESLTRLTLAGLASRIETRS